MVDDRPAQPVLLARVRWVVSYVTPSVISQRCPWEGGLGLNPGLIEAPPTPQVFLESTRRATTPSCGIISSSTLTSTLITPTSWMGTQLTCRPSVLLSRRRSRLQAGSNSLLEVSMAQREALSLGKKRKERTSGGEGRSLRVLRAYRVSRPGCSGLLGPGSRQEEGRSSTSPVWSGREAFHTILS